MMLRSWQPQPYSTMLFRREYDRLNEMVYKHALPQFPGVIVRRMRRTLGATHVRRIGAERELLAFRLNAKIVNHTPLLLDVIRHEVAHAGSVLLDGAHGHGDVWVNHALRCGARPRACADEDLLPADPPSHPQTCETCDLSIPFATRIGTRARDGRRCRRCRLPLIALRNP